MSKEKPEVGDVWVSKFAKYYIVKIYTKISICIVKDTDIRMSVIDLDYLKNNSVYLGESKTDIMELFEIREELFDVAED